MFAAKRGESYRTQNGWENKPGPVGMEAAEARVVRETVMPVRQVTIGSDPPSGPS